MSTAIAEEKKTGTKLNQLEQLKKFMWMTTCISSAVFENKNYKYVFRPQASGDQFGMMTMDYIAQNSKEKFGKEPKDLRVAIIHEDGAYGVDVAKGRSWLSAGMRARASSTLFKSKSATITPGSAPPSASTSPQGAMMTLWP